MKKAMSAFFSGLMLAGAVAAAYEAFRRNRRRELADVSQVQQPLGPTQLAPDLVDLNSCTLDDLLTLEGMDRDIADRVIENRPYRNKLDLVSRMIVPEPTYVMFSRSVIASQPEEPVKVA
jgi:DNA uptake protein ComE-like DNA-binding protein